MQPETDPSDAVGKNYRAKYVPSMDSRRALSKSKEHQGRKEKYLVTCPNFASFARKIPSLVSPRCGLRGEFSIRIFIFRDPKPETRHQKPAAWRLEFIAEDSFLTPGFFDGNFHISDGTWELLPHFAFDLAGNVLGQQLRARVGNR